MKLLILAGGFGTRLKSVVSDVPKALAPIGNTSFLALQLDHWCQQGLRDFIFLLHHQGNLIINFLENEKNGLLRNCNVQWVTEPEPMDTGGALAYAISQLNISGDFMVTNADTWLGSGIKEVWQTPSPAMAVVKVANAGRYGQVEFNESNLVTSFNEKSTNIAPGWINAGLGHFHTDLFLHWNEKPFSLEKEKYPLWANNALLQAVPLDCNFIDIGIPEDYYRLNEWIKSEKVGVL